MKSAEQQAVLMLRRTREPLARQRTVRVNALRGHMAKLGTVAPQGISRVGDLVAALLGEDEAQLPKLARYALRGLAVELGHWATGWRRSRRRSWPGTRTTKPAAGSRPSPAWGRSPSAIVAAADDPAQFHPVRQFAAWIGLVPKQSSSGGKQRQGGISKQGDRTLRRLLVLGAATAIRHA